MLTDYDVRRFELAYAQQRAEIETIREEGQVLAAQLGILTAALAELSSLFNALLNSGILNAEQEKEFVETFEKSHSELLKVLNHSEEKDAPQTNMDDTATETS